MNHHFSSSHNSFLNCEIIFRQQRVQQQVRMVNPNVMQGNQNNPRMVLPQMAQNRQPMMQNPQQPINQMNIQGIQAPMGNQALIGQQPQQQQQQNAVPPPPPYPEPPPPYPGQSNTGQSQVRSHSDELIFIVLV